MSPDVLGQYRDSKRAPRERSIRGRELESKRVLGLDARVPDERASFQLAFPDGVTALCSVSQNAYKTAEFRVVGTAGEVRMRPGFFGAQENELLLSTPVGETSVTYEPADQMRELFCFFADRVLGGKSIPADGRHGLADMRVVEAVYDAAEDETRRQL